MYFQRDVFKNQLKAQPEFLVSNDKANLKAHFYIAVPAQRLFRENVSMSRVCLIILFFNLLFAEGNIIIRTSSGGTFILHIHITYCLKPLDFSQMCTFHSDKLYA